MNILILGCGQLGQALALQLHHLGHDVTTVSRSPKQLPTGIQHITQDIHQFNLNDYNHIQFDWVYVILSPKTSTIEAYQDTYINTIQPITTALKHHSIQQLILISSTRVYGENSGYCVDDYTTPSTQDPLGQCLIAAELLWQAYWKEKLIILRPSGLYQHDSKRLQTLARNLTHVTELHWMNLIHRQDVIRFLIYLMTIPTEQRQSSYILTNSTPKIRAEFLNSLRQKQALPYVTIPQYLPITGKKLYATHMINSGFKLKFDF